MKESYYNFYIPQESIILLYNSLSKSYMAVKKEKFNNFLKNGRLQLNNLKKADENLYKTLSRNGYIVDDNIDECELYENIYTQSRYSKSRYELCINPTLDCNLKCWYCYENHVKKSKMSNDIIERVLLNIENKYKSEPFKVLSLAFFGGEPFLQPKIIIQLLKKVKLLQTEYDFKLFVNFTTNATVIPNLLLDELKNETVSFQITLDGNAAQHDKIRCRKNAKVQIGTYKQIINNIKRINQLKNCNITVRINFTAETFNGLETVVDDLKECDRKRLVFALHRVWQDKSPINKKAIISFINYARKNLFRVNYMLFQDYSSSGCYANRYNQAVINYNGDVFKCTARSFATKDREGYLDDFGNIVWNTQKFLDRMNVRLQSSCRSCKLLPACSGICSQQRLENPNTELCILNDFATIEEYIIMNFNNQMLQAKILAS